MGIVARLTHTCTIKRKNTGSGIRRTTATVASGVPCLVQSVDDTARREQGMAFGKGFRGYFKTDAVIQEGDHIVYDDGNEFAVTGLARKEYGSDAVNHIVVSLEKAMEVGDNG